MRNGTKTALSALAVGLTAMLAWSCGGGAAATPQIAAEPAQPETVAAEAPSPDVTAGQVMFEQNCLACHTIGEGVRVGPDLKDVTSRRNRNWLTNWIDDPIAMGQTDSIAQALIAEYNGIQMAPNQLNLGQIGQVIQYIEWAGEHAPTQVAAADGAPIDMTEAEMVRASGIFFDRCAGCHGTLRAGATGPNIQPARTTEIGSGALKVILTNGTPDGMPAWGRSGILSEDEIDLMVKFVQNPPPEPPQRPLSMSERVGRSTFPSRTGPLNRLPHGTGKTILASFCGTSARSPSWTAIHTNSSPRSRPASPCISCALLRPAAISQQLVGTDG